MAVGARWGGRWPRCGSSAGRGPRRPRARPTRKSDHDKEPSAVPRSVEGPQQRQRIPHMPNHRIRRGVAQREPLRVDPHGLKPRGLPSAHVLDQVVANHPPAVFQRSTTSVSSDLEQPPVRLAHPLGPGTDVSINHVRQARAPDLAHLVVRGSIRDDPHPPPQRPQLSPQPEPRTNLSENSPQCATPHYPAQPARQPPRCPAHGHRRTPAPTRETLPAGQSECHPGQKRQSSHTTPP